MSDFVSGPILEKMRERRHFSSEVLLIAVALALLINVFATSLLNILTLEQKDLKLWYWLAGISGFMSLGFTSLAILRLLSRKESEYSGLTVLLPVQVDHEKGIAEILHHDAYAPAKHGRLLFSQAGRELAKTFAANWPGSNPLKDQNFKPGHFCWDKIAELAIALTTLFIKQFCELTLTDSAHFHGEFRSLAGKISPSHIPKEEWPHLLRENTFLVAQALNKLSLPRGTRLSDLPSESTVGARSHLMQLNIGTSYCTITFSLSPYWTVITKDEKTRVEFPHADFNKTCFLALPVEICLSMKGLYFSERKMVTHYLWSQKIVENARRRMSWGTYLRAV